MLKQDKQSGNPETKALLITAIEIDVAEKIVREIKIDNTISAIRKKLRSAKHSEIFIGEAMACLIVVAEEQINKELYFEIAGTSKKIYSNGIVVRVPKNYNMERLLKCNITIEGVRKMVRFN